MRAKNAALIAAKLRTDVNDPVNCNLFIIVMRRLQIHFIDLWSI